MTMKRAVGLVLLLFWLGLSVYADTAEKNSAPDRTRIPKSGKTLLSAMSPKGKANVTIETVTIEGSCLKACPTASFMTESGADDASVVQHLSISIDDKLIAVPPSVYSGLFNIMWASVNYKNDSFDLTINEGVDLYLVHIYFSSRYGITRMTVYDYVTAKVVEDARFYQAVIK